MNDRTPAWAILSAAVLLPALAGCASSAPESAGPSSDGEEAPPAAAVELPCGVADASELEAIFGTSFGAGTVGLATVTQNETTWTPETCSWEGADGLEIAVRIAEAEDFAEGFECLEPLAIGSDVTPVDGIGAQAWWEFDDFSGAEGMLRVCADTVVLDVLVEAETGDSTALEGQAIALAELTLAKL